MKKKIISIAVATVFVVSSTHVLSETFDENSTENELNYTAIGIGATTGGLLLGPVGILIGSVMGSLYDSDASEDDLQNAEQNMAQGIEVATEPDLDMLTEKPEHNAPEGLLLASSSDSISFIDEDSSQKPEKESNRIKEIIANDLSLTVYFKPGSVSFENFYSQQFSTISNLLNEMPEMELNLDGYSDRQGEASDNLKLSTDRLESVRDYFVNNGIDKNRIHIHAYGEKNFLSTPGELDSYIYDRRVVVSFKAAAQIPKDKVAVVINSTSK